jgi:hypothetical protein
MTAYPRAADSSSPRSPGTALSRAPTRPSQGLVFGAVIVSALIAFEAFNYGTTEFALSDLLGDMKILGMRWSTVLALAFCGIDFAGIARLFTPARGEADPYETWYLLGAWFLAAGMNALLTWWAVSLALLNHASLGAVLLGRETLLEAAPAFIAALVWMIRVLIIGTLTLAGRRLFSQGDLPQGAYPRPSPVRSAAPQLRNPS